MVKVVEEAFSISLIYQAARCLPNNGLSAHLIRLDVDVEESIKMHACVINEDF